MIFRGTVFVVLFIAAIIPAVGQDQVSTPPDEVYTGSFGFGLAVTGGNTDTSSYNLSFDLTRDPKTNNVIKINAFYLRSDTDGEATADMLRFNFRDEYEFTERVFAYGDYGYLRDRFKDIIYLHNPQGGLGYRIYNTDRLGLTLSGGGGAVWEKNSGVDVNTSGTLNMGQNFRLKLSESAEITQNFAALWKTNDFEDALYHFDVGLAATIIKNIAVKIEFRNDYKNVTPSPDIKNNDTAFITSVQYKF
jgi:putative salt-induced outer membrane protein YdiY